MAVDVRLVAFGEELSVVQEIPGLPLAEWRTLLTVEKLTWLREISVDDVDCLWKWRKLAILAGVKPTNGEV